MINEYNNKPPKEKVFQEACDVLWAINYAPNLFRSCFASLWP